MKTFGLVLLTVLLSLGLVACGNDDNSLQSATYDLEAVDNSGVTGTVKFEELADTKTKVTIDVSGDAVIGGHPAHIHEGDVGSGGDIAYPLENVDASGDSVTTLDADYDVILNGDFYVNVHLSSDDLSVVSTGEVGDGATAK